MKTDLNLSVSKTGLDQTITDLEYDNPGSPKTNFIQALKWFYRGFRLAADDVRR